VSQVGAEAGQMKDVTFGVATPDGSVVYFTSLFELIEGAGRGGVYRYDVPTRELTAVIPNPPAGGVEAHRVIGAGGDGSYVYFTASAALTADATPAGGSSTNIYAWHDGTVRWIAQTAPEDSEVFSPRESSVSPDGKVLGITASSPLTPEDVSSPACPEESTIHNAPEHCLDAYAYSWATNRLTCVSCKGQTNAKGEWEWLPGRGFSELGGEQTHEAGTGDEYARPVLDDGTVFFDTPNALSPRDVNGVGDVYGWREGSAELVSTGKGEQPSYFGDATANGSDVYFLTKQQLVPLDTDESTDIYDDRELGGLVSQWPPGAEPPCEGEGCRGTAPSAPAGLPQGSAAAVVGKAVPRACGPLRARARKASRHARRLTKRARHSARQGKSKAQSRRLRRKATTARKRAHHIHQKATTCGRKG
jgi:hypothetical protein